MSPALRRRFGPAAILGCAFASAGCDTDFSPGWQEQLDALNDAGARPEPPAPEDAGQPDAMVPEPPRPDAGPAPIALFDCTREYLCDRRDPSCAPLCLVPSMLLDGCKPGESCRAEGYSPVRCEYCQRDPVK